MGGVHAVTVWISGERAALCSACCSSRASTGSAARRGSRRGQAGGRDGASFRHAAEDYFHDMDGGVALTPRDQGRNMWMVWSGGNDRFWDEMTDYTFGAFDLLKIVGSHPTLEATPRPTRWNYFGLVNEPCFEKATAPDPNRVGLWLDVRARTARRPVRGRDEVSRRRHRRARRRHDARSARSTATPPASSACACSRTRRSTRRRPRRWDPERYYTDPELLQPQGSGASLPRRHVVRLLPCRAEPGESAGRPGAPGVGEPELDRSARSTCGSTGCSSTTRKPSRTNYMYPARSTPTGRAHGHLAGLDRQHQQPAHDERGLQPRRAAGHGASAGARRRSPAASSTTSSSTTSSPAAR